MEEMETLTMEEIQVEELKVTEETLVAMVDPPVETPTTTVDPVILVTTVQVTEKLLVTMNQETEETPLAMVLKTALTTEGLETVLVTVQKLDPKPVSQRAHLLLLHHQMFTKELLHHIPSHGVCLHSS